MLILNGVVRLCFNSQTVGIKYSWYGLDTLKSKQKGDEVCLKISSPSIFEVRGTIIDVYKRSFIPNGSDDEYTEYQYKIEFTRIDTEHFSPLTRSVQFGTGGYNSLGETHYPISEFGIRLDGLLVSILSGIATLTPEFGFNSVSLGGTSLPYDYTSIPRYRTLCIVAERLEIEPSIKNFSALAAIALAIPEYTQDKYLTPKI